MPIAIVGIGGRFPGDASNPDRLWELLLNAKSTLSETPEDRFSADAFYHPQPDRPGTSNSCGGHFMNQNIEEFDAPFFSITPSEARAMDPQQRMCLEVAYEAMENGLFSSAIKPFPNSDSKQRVLLWIVSPDLAPLATSGASTMITSSSRTWISIIFHFITQQGPSHHVSRIVSRGSSIWLAQA